LLFHCFMGFYLYRYSLMLSLWCFQHRNTLAGNFVMSYTDPIEDTYILDKDSEMLGRGGYGIVVLGIHKHSGIKYAVKFMNKDALEKKNSRINRLEREYKLLKDIDHANIVRLYAVYDSIHEVGFVMELCSGGHLGTWLEYIKYEPMRVPPEQTIISIMRQLLSAVAHMHTRGICHRDIKLQNILRESSQPGAQIKLCDFGLGTRFIGALPLRTHCGTLYTTAPEVIRESYDQRCDIWSCGVVAFTLLCGRKPFEALVMQPVYGETPSGKSSVTANILMGRYHFKNKEWKRRSEASKEFVRLMMTQDYRQRWYAQEALEHKWFLESSVKNSLIDASKSADVADEDDKQTRTSHSLSMASEDSADMSLAVSVANSKKEDLQPLLANMKRQADSSVLHQASRLAVAYNMPQSQATDKRRQIFQAFDEDNNGSLSRKEFHKAFKEIGILNMMGGNNSRQPDAGIDKSTSIDGNDDEMLNLSETDIDKVFDAVDVNGDNEISFTEFLAATLDPRDFDTLAINTAFGILDVDKKGYITVDDMERVLAVTATARGRRRSHSSKGNGGGGSTSGFYPLVSNDRPSPKVTVKKEVATAPLVRRHHSFTMGVKGGSRRQSLFKYSQRSMGALSPVNSAVKGDSVSDKNSEHDSGAESTFEKAIKESSERRVIEEKNEKKEEEKGEANAEADIEIEPPAPKIDNRPGVQRQRSQSTLSIGDFLRRPSLMSKNRQLEDFIRKPKSSTSTFSFVNLLKSSPVVPSFVEEGEYSNSEVKEFGKKAKAHPGAKYDVGENGSDEKDHSAEVLSPKNLRALSSPMLGHANSFGRASVLKRENSHEQNYLNEIDDRTYEQIKRAIKLCDRNNTGVVSYTG
jgi:calcium-dependent protein kinase